MFLLILASADTADMWDLRNTCLIPQPRKSKDFSVAVSDLICCAEWLRGWTVTLNPLQRFFFLDIFLKLEPSFPQVTCLAMCVLFYACAFLVTQTFDCNSWRQIFEGPNPCLVTTEENLQTFSLFCRRFSDPHSWRVYAGILNQDEMLFRSGYRVQLIISHPDYDTDSKDNDVALMKLETPLSFTGRYSALLKGKIQWQRAHLLKLLNFIKKSL